MASTMYRTLQKDHRDILKALTDRTTALTEQIGYQDIMPKVPELSRSKVLGILMSLQHRGLADNRNGIWFRTEAGDRVAAKS